MEERIALPHNEENAGTAGIFRVRGAQEDGAESRILKIARPPAEHADPSAWPTSDAPDYFNYWRREVEAYGSGFAHSAYAEAGIRAPRLLAADAREDGCVELWLEDVAGPSGFDLPFERLGRFSYELGVGQARWAGRVPPPAELPWLSRRWLAQYASQGPHAEVAVAEADWDNPALRVWPERALRSLRRLWESRASVLEVAQSFPRTLCHLDLWPANLIVDADGTSVLIDWAFVGEGAIGEDLGNLIVDSVTDGLIDMALLPELADVLTDGYLKGLTDGGWDGSADGARAASAACGAAKYAWLGAAIVAGAAGGSDPAELSRLAPLIGTLAHWADSVLE